ncbi:MAG: hydroxymyristoyl-ACP dehydratase [Legionella sp. 40-6]|nr:hydroxymyristoyl-ACP dehydratase [Legionella sp.]OJY39235.1 MAG: hydroxymyristoyl-ACP dehydratase [Legionella sp. 40-6]
MRFLFVDRIVESAPGAWIRGLKHVTHDDYFLTTDKEGRACFIPSLIGETLGQLAAWNVMSLNDFSSRPVAGIVDSARLYRPAYVGETLLLESHIDSLDERAVQYHSEARVGSELVFSISGALGPLLPMDDFIEKSIVREQFAEINRHTDWFALCADLNIIPMQELLGASNENRRVNMSFDRICSSEPGISLIAEKRLSRAAPYFPDHFPKKPVLPMTVLLECKINLAYEFILRAGYTTCYQVAELRKIKMNEFVHPGDVIECLVTVKRRDEQELVLSFRSTVAGKRVCVMDAVLIPRG